MQQVNAQNAIVIRDTPDKLALAAKIIGDIDKAKPEVLIHVQVLTASVNRLRDLGVLPGQSISVAFTPRSAFQPNSTSTTSDLHHYDDHQQHVDHFEHQQLDHS